MSKKQIVKLTIVLQHKLEQMDEVELAQFLNENDLEFGGKIYRRQHDQATITEQQDEEVRAQGI
jgi:hypothetical protein